MTKSVERNLGKRKFGIAMLAVLSGVATGWPSTVTAQVAGGSERGVGAPLGVDGALLVRPGPVEPPRCIHRAIDLRRSANQDDNRLIVWLTVHLPVIAVIKAGGTASGARTGTIAMTVIQDGVPIARSPEVRGTEFIAANTNASVSLVPGRQYKFTAKGVVSNKRLDLFDMYVGVGKTCP